MEYSVRYNRVESVNFVLDEGDLRQAALEHLQKDRLWPKGAANGKVTIEFGDTDNEDEPSRVYCEVTVTFSQAVEAPPSVDAVDPVLSNSR